MPIITKEENREIHSDLGPAQNPDKKEATIAKTKPEQYEKLFSQVGPIKKKHDAGAAEKGENFNLFKILNIHTDEVRLHSRFLAELLNPKGSHQQGTKFLELFINQLFPDFDFNAKTARVEIEEVIDNKRRLDIYLRDDKGSAIIIENKIYAGDQNDQLYDYHEFAQKTTQRFRLIYLTLKGTEPSANSVRSLKKEQHYICLSYQDGISAWLKACQNEVSKIPLIRESISQYLLNIGFLTNQSMDQGYLKEIEEILTKDENYLLVSDLQKALTLLKISSLQALMHELFKQLERLPEIKDQNLFFTNKDEEINSAELEKLIKAYYQGKVSQFGICIPLFLGSTSNLALKIELNYSLYYGFASLHQGRLTKLSDTQSIAHALAQQPHLLADFTTGVDSFLYLRKLDHKVPFHPKDINTEGLKILIDKTERQQWIETFVEGIKEVLSLVLPNKVQ